MTFETNPFYIKNILSMQINSSNRINMFETNPFFLKNIVSASQLQKDWFQLVSRIQSTSPVSLSTVIRVLFFRYKSIPFCKTDCGKKA